MPTVTCDPSFTEKSAVVLMLKALEHRCGGVLPDLILACLWSFIRVIFPTQVGQDDEYYLRRIFNYAAADTLNRELLGVMWGFEIVSLPMDDFEEDPAELACIAHISSACISENGMICYTVENDDNVRCMSVREGSYKDRPVSVLPSVSDSSERLIPFRVRGSWLFVRTATRNPAVYTINTKSPEAWEYVMTLETDEKAGSFGIKCLDIDFATSDCDPTRVFILYTYALNDGKVYFRSNTNENLSKDVSIKYRRGCALIPSSGGIACVAVYMGDDDRFSDDESMFLNEWIGIWVVDPYSGIVLYRTDGYSANSVNSIVVTRDWEIFMILATNRDPFGDDDDDESGDSVYHLKLAYD